MKENDILRKKFQGKGMQMAEWLRSINSQLSHETYSRIINRDRPVSLENLLIMAVELGCATDEIKEMLLLRGDKKIAELVAPAALSDEDQRFLEKLHALKGDQGKLKLVSDLLDTLGR